MHNDGHFIGFSFVLLDFTEFAVKTQIYFTYLAKPDVFLYKSPILK